MATEINISHLNMQRSCKGADFLVGYCEQFSKETVFLTSLNEPPLSNNGKKINGMETFELYFIEPKPRAAIAVRGRNVEVLFLKHLSSSDFAVIQVKVKDMIPFYMVSMYFQCDHDLEIDLSFLESKILSQINPNEPLVLCTDSNCRSPLWGDTNGTYSHVRGNTLFEFFSEQNLIIKNSFSEATFASDDGKRSSVIDLIITNSHTMFELSSCVLNDQPSPVDHSHLILTDVNLLNGDNLPNCSLNSCVRYNTRAETWDQFSNSLNKFKYLLDECNKMNLATKRGLDRAIHKLQKYIQKACDDSLPRVSRSKGRKDPYNDTKKSLEILEQANFLQKKWHQLSNVNTLLANDYRIKYFDTLKQYHNERKSFLNKNFRNYCESDSVINSYKIHSSLREKTRCILTAFPDGSGKYANSIQENLLNVLDTFLPDNNHPILPDIHHLNLLTQHLPDAQYHVDYNTLKAFVFGMKPHKAPGIDGISPIILQKAFDTIGNHLMMILNGCIMLNYFPDVWKKGIVVLIPKPNNGNCPAAKCFRPITLLPIIGKILERFFMNPLNDWLYKSNLMSLNQFGFVKQTSTIDALTNFVSRIEQSFNNQKMCLCLSLDISGAFDNASFTRILEALISLNGPSNLIRMIGSYFRNRTVSITFGDISQERTARQGCPQGSVSGPFLWNILLNLLFKTFFEKWNNEDIDLQAFADDTIFNILFYRKDMQKAFRIANEILALVHNWGNENYLNFNPSKTQAIVFHRSNKPIIFHQLVMNGQVIELSQHIKLLGMFLDSKLNFNKHINYVIDKGRKELNILSVHTRNTWGSSPEVTRTLVTSVIYPKITYGACIWFKCLKRKKILQIIRKFSYHCSKKIVKSYRTISRVAAATLSGTLPLELYILKYAQYEITKRNGLIPDFYFLPINANTSTELIVDQMIHHLNEHPIYSKTCTFNRFINEIPDFGHLMSASSRGTTELLPRIHWTRLNEFNRLIINSINNVSISYDIIINTDGSKLEDNGTGFGFLIDYQGENIYSASFPIDTCCSVFQAELLAICGAIDYVCTLFLDRPFNSVLIRTDSQSSIGAINNFYTDNPIVLAIRMNLEQLNIRGIFTNIVWVKSHMGDVGNETADSLAKTGASIELDSQDNGYFNNWPISRAKYYINGYMWSYFATHCLHSPNPFGGSVMNDWLKGLLPRDPNELSKLIKNKIINTVNYFTCQFFTGHGSFSSYLERFKIAETNNICLACHTNVDSPYHTLFECVESRSFTRRLYDLGIHYMNTRSILQNITADRSDDDNLDKNSLFTNICEELITFKNNIFRDSDLNPP